MLVQRSLTLAITAGLLISMSPIPANASTCTKTDTKSVRSLLVPVTRISAHQGKNLEEIETVLASVREIIGETKSLKLKNSLQSLEDVILEGELNPGSTEFWGYREGSAWKTYRQALTLTQKNRC
jgi:hypothetical protein